MNYDLREMACDILKQWLIEQAKLTAPEDIACDDPDANGLPLEDYNMLMDNISRAKVNVTVTL